MDINNEITWVAFSEVIGNYWEQNLEMIQTFWFERLGEGEV